MTTPRAPRYYLECKKCRRIFVPLHNAGITPVSYAVFLTTPVGVSEEQRRVFEFVQTAATLPLPQRARELSKIFIAEAPDIVFGGSQSKDNEQIMPLPLEEGPLEFTLAVLELETESPDPSSRALSLIGLTPPKATRYWKCNDCGQVHRYLLSPLEEKSFVGNTLKEVTNLFENAIPRSRLISFQHKAQGESAVTLYADSPTDALDEVRRKYNAKDFLISKMTQPHERRAAGKARPETPPVRVARGPRADRTCG